MKYGRLDRGFFGYILVLIAIAYGLWYAGRIFYETSLTESNVDPREYIDSARDTKNSVERRY